MIIFHNKYTTLCDISQSVGTQWTCFVHQETDKLRIKLFHFIWSIYPGILTNGFPLEISGQLCFFLLISSLFFTNIILVWHIYKFGGNFQRQNELFYQTFFKFLESHFFPPFAFVLGSQKNHLINLMPLRHPQLTS